jgi:hypothetical protein
MIRRPHALAFAIVLANAAAVSPAVLPAVIYSSSGIQVAQLAHNDPAGGGEASWNLRNRSGRPVSSGVYFYHVEGPDGQTRAGRFTVVTGP